MNPPADPKKTQNVLKNLQLGTKKDTYENAKKSFTVGVTDSDSVGKYEHHDQYFHNEKYTFPPSHAESVEPP